ncbi:hypothetical protein J437_LFUL010482 [Ladona fulva]|uniref:Nuclear protein MDM1 n=1 Tax=Ladona fulva TaxID=123851 RepID=A0A8K0KE23_LADFU|nr:hypothetical protein J437_LFUL010482 [Ladona fulva]
MKPKTIPAKSVNGVQTSKLKVDRSKSQEKKDAIVDIADMPDTKTIDKDDTSQPPQSSMAPQAQPVETSTESGEAPEKSLVEEPQSLPHMNGEGSWEEEVPSSHLDEPLVKSPPEPTRVKSPEQILMRSPEPVNWTVPLDTGKTFTVTQNVLEGDLSRPHSEAKVWTPPGPSSLSGDSLPVKEQSRVPSESPAQVDEIPGWKSPVSEPLTSSETSNLKSVNGLEETYDNEAASEEEGEKRISKSPETIEVENSALKSSLPLSESPQKKNVTPECEKVVAGTTLKCLEDPSFVFDNQPSRGPVSEEVPHTAYRVLEAPGVPSDVLYQPTEMETSTAQPAPSSMPTTSQGQPTGSSTPTASVGGAPLAGPYRILEAPEIPSQESPTKALPSLVSPSTGRSLASDVLEKARTRFDKFWGKGKDSDREGKV